MSHTYVILGVSQATWDEIAGRLRAANYDQAFHEDGVVDLHGIAIQVAEKASVREWTPQRPGGLTEEERDAAQAEINATARTRLDALNTADPPPTDNRPVYYPGRPGSPWRSESNPGSEQPLHSTTTLGPDGEPMTVRHQHAYGTHRFRSPWRHGDPMWHKPPNGWRGFWPAEVIEPLSEQGSAHNIYVGDVYTGVVHNVAADKPNEGTPDDRHDRPDSPFHDEGALGAQAAEADAAGGGSLRVRPPAHDREPIGAATGGAGAGRDAPEHLSVPDMPDARAAGALDREVGDRPPPRYRALLDARRIDYERSG